MFIELRGQVEPNGLSPFMATKKTATFAVRALLGDYFSSGQPISTSLAWLSIRFAQPSSRGCGLLSLALLTLLGAILI